MTTHAAHAQQRRAAIFGVVDGFFEAFQSAARKKEAHLRCQRALNGFFEKAKNFECQTFANLQSDISYEAVADDYIDDTGEKIAALDVADEMHGGFFEASVDFAG